MTDSKDRSGDLDALVDAVLSLRTRDEIRNFLADLCTMSELNAMAQRYLVAHLLRAGHTSQDIVRQTGCSTATISRVNRCLRYGTGGYKLALDRAEGDQEERDTNE